MKRTLTFAVALFGFCVASNAHAAGLPQLDPTWYANQIFWLMVSFVSLYLLVSGYIVPTIAAILNTREAAIKDAIREAEHAKATAESTRHQYESAGHAARTKAAETLAKAQAKASAESNEAFAKLDRDLERKLEQADVRIGEAVTRAQNSLSEATASLAQAMAAKLLERDNVANDTAKASRKKAG